jgi:hypothetical protein
MAAAAKATTTPLNIYQAMVAIKSEVGSISKDRKNAQQGYNFRGVDDVYHALQLVMAKHGVISIPTVLSEKSEERTTKSGGGLIYRILTIKYTFYASDGSSLESVVIGEGMDSGDKASNKAMSVADKYALIQAFKIPTADAKDPENDSHEVEPKAAPTPVPRPTPNLPAREPAKYDNSNTDHQDLVVAKIKGKVDQIYWEEIGAALHGKPFTELKQIADEVVGAHKAFS